MVKRGWRREKCCWAWSGNDKAYTTPCARQTTECVCTAWARTHTRAVTHYRQMEISTQCKQQAGPEWAHFDAATDCGETMCKQCVVVVVNCNSLVSAKIIYIKLKLRVTQFKKRLVIVTVMFIQKFVLYERHAGHNIINLINTVAENRWVCSRGGNDQTHNTSLMLQL